MSVKVKLRVGWLSHKDDCVRTLETVLVTTRGDES